MVDIRKDISDTLIEFYERFMKTEFRAICSKLDEHDQKFKDLLNRIKDLEKRLKSFS